MTFQASSHILWLCSRFVSDLVGKSKDRLIYLTGDKKFIMGDQPSEVDCAAFGQLSQILYQTPDSCPGKVLLKGMYISVQVISKLTTIAILLSIQKKKRCSAS